MQVFVKEPCGHTITVDVPEPAAAHSVAALKRAVAEQTGIPTGTFRLISASQQLERDELTLHDYGVRSGSTIDAQLRVAGGSRKKLYHQTDRDGLRGIKRAGGMRKGASGLAGPVIYFADTPES